MRPTSRAALAALLIAFTALSSAGAQQANVFAPVDDREPFAAVRSRMEGNKAAVIQRHRQLLDQRYDLADRPGAVSMSGGKPVQTGVRVKLSPGVTWTELASLAPAQIRERNIFPAGFLPLPHPNHAEGGMLFPQSHIDRNTSCPRIRRRSISLLDRISATYRKGSS
jgi:cytochrome c peroxidase